MSDNVSVPSGSGAVNVIIGADEVADATLGTVKVQYMKLMDGTLDSTVKSTIKAANTAPVAADPALVVTMSPKAARPADLTNSGTLTANGQAFTLACAGATVGSWSIPGGNNFVGTIKVQASYDGGNNFFDIPMLVGGNTTQQTSVALVSAGTGAGFIIPAGSTHIALVCAVYTSGTGTFTLNAGNTGGNGLVTITDGTNNAAVKAASTAPVATDPALVVSMSPNSATFVQGIQGARNTGNITAATSVVGPFTATGFNIATVTVSGTYTGVTFVFEGTDDGTNWFTLQGCRTDISIVETGATVLSTTTRAWDVPVGAMTQVRVRATAWATGTAVIGVSFQSMPYEPAPAVGLSSVGGTSITAKTVPATGAGLAAIPVYNNAVQSRTHYATFRNLATGALTANTAKAIFSMAHSAASTKTVKIRRILASGYQTTSLAGTLDFQFNRGTALVTAGTQIFDGVAIASDSLAEVALHTLPTITAATVIAIKPGFATPTTTATGFQSTVIYDWQESGETKPITLRAGVLESFVINVLSTAAQNWTLTMSITFTEE